MFAVNSGPVNYQGTWIMFAGIYFCDLNNVEGVAKNAK